MPRAPAPQLRLGPMGHSGYQGCQNSGLAGGWAAPRHRWLVIITSESLGARALSLISLAASAPGSVGQGTASEGDRGVYRGPFI